MASVTEKKPYDTQSPVSKREFAASVVVQQTRFSRDATRFAGCRPSHLTPLPRLLPSAPRLDAPRLRVQAPQAESATQASVSRALKDAFVRMIKQGGKAAEAWRDQMSQELCTLGAREAAEQAIRQADRAAHREAKEKRTREVGLPSAPRRPCNGLWGQSFRGGG